jgi:nucleoid DNA-binding protein
MNRKELAKAISVDMGGRGMADEVRHIERMLASMSNVIASAMRSKEKVTIDNLCSFHPFTGKTRVINTLYGKRVIPETERVQTRWSKKFMKEIQETS